MSSIAIAAPEEQAVGQQNQHCQNQWGDGDENQPEKVCIWHQGHHFTGNLVGWKRIGSSVQVRYYQLDYSTGNGPLAGKIMSRFFDISPIFFASEKAILRTLQAFDLSPPIFQHNKPVPAPYYPQGMIFNFYSNIYCRKRHWGARFVSEMGETIDLQDYQAISYTGPPFICADRYGIQMYTDYKCLSELRIVESPTIPVILGHLIMYNPAESTLQNRMETIDETKPLETFTL